MSGVSYLISGELFREFPPFIRAQDGSRISGLDRLSEDELSALDITVTPPMPEYDPDSQRLDWHDGEWVVSDLPPPPPSTADEFSAAIQRHLDAKAQERQYDSLLTGITYRDDPFPQFAAEGEALFAWRSDVWAYALGELRKVEAGERETPTIDEIIGELPAFEWPDAGAAA